MVIDYSKWDAIEVSDDSDVEVHPNVDKKSFIRAKQAQIHQERAQREHRILTLEYERTLNDGLLLRIGRLLTALKSHRDISPSSSAEELVFQALIESAGDPKEDTPPDPPAGIHANVKEQRYSKMMATLVDQVKQEVDKSNTQDRYDGFIKEIGKHQSNVEGLQKELLAKLAELEMEKKRHITSDDIHYGFDVSHVSHGQSKSSGGTAVSTSTKPTKEVELINAPGRPSLDQTDTGQSSGANADVEDDDDDSDIPDHIELSDLAKEFARVPMGDFKKCRDFIFANKTILKSREYQALMAEAFSSELDGNHKQAQKFVHQGLLLQYCREVARGEDREKGPIQEGIAKKPPPKNPDWLRNPEHWRVATELICSRMARKEEVYTAFTDDVRRTYLHIRTRVAEYLKKQEGVEQIQLQAPNGKEPNITVPPPLDILTDPNHPQFPKDAEQEDIDRTIEARKVFETFPPGLQRAMESGKLEEINKVLAKMSVDEGEDIVDKMGATQMLSIEQGVIDATTEEGRRRMEEIERMGNFTGYEGQSGVVEELSGEPGPALEDTVD